jgi:hypothetical protein
MDGSSRVQTFGRSNRGKTPSPSPFPPSRIGGFGEPQRRFSLCAENKILPRQESIRDSSVLQALAESVHETNYINKQ